MNVMFVVTVAATTTSVGIAVVGCSGGGGMVTVVSFKDAPLE